MAEAQARRLESVYEQLATLLRQPGIVQRLRKRKTEQEWSAMEVLGHMTEMIPYWLASCRMLVAASTKSPQFGRSLDAPERLEGVERAASGDPDQVLQLLQAEVEIAVSVIRSMSPSQRSKRGVHVRRGEMTLTDIIEVFIVAHAEEHLEQLRAALSQ